MIFPNISLTKSVGLDAAPLIVLGPSLGTSAILWEDVVPALAATYRVVTWDLPGHGAAPVATDAFTVADLADAIADAIDEPFLYAGVSLGGAVGLMLGLSHPEVVRSAAIIASGAMLGTPEGWRERAVQVRAQSTSSVISGSTQRWFAPDSIAQRPELSGRLLQTLQDADDESYALCCEALAEYDLRASLGEVQMPVLAIWGEYDHVAPEAKAVEIASGVRDGRAMKISDAAHLPPAEQPGATAAALADFFQEAR